MYIDSTLYDSDTQSHFMVDFQYLICRYDVSIYSFCDLRYNGVHVPLLDALSHIVICYYQMVIFVIL